MWPFSAAMKKGVPPSTMPSRTLVRGSEHRNFTTCQARPYQVRRLSTARWTALSTHLQVAILARHIQRCGTAAHALRDINALVGGKELDHLQVAVLASNVERRRADGEGLGHVDVGVRC